MQNDTSPTTRPATIYPRREVVYNLDDIRAVMEHAGSHFWEPDGMRFFASRIPMGQTLYRFPSGDFAGRLAFVTSEKASFDDPTRRWSVRTWDPARWNRRSLDTPDELGGFTGHQTKARALRAIREAGGVPLTKGVTLAEVTR